MPAGGAAAVSGKRNNRKGRERSKVEQGVGNLSESMSTLGDEKYVVKASIDDLDLSDSAKSPRDEKGSEHEENENLRHRSLPQNDEQGGLQQKRVAPQTIGHGNTAKRTSSTDRDDFNENNVTESSTSPVDNQHSWLKRADDLRKLIGKVVNDYRVQNTVLLLIAINSIMMGVATFPIVKQNQHVQDIFDDADQIFLVLFTIESAMQLIYHGWKILKDGFLVFDLLVVVMSWALEGGAQVFRALRIFRATRLITRIDTLKNLILALISVFPKMTAIAMFLCLIFYIFAVMFTQLFKGMTKPDQVEHLYFENIYRSLFTLFQMMTLDEWYDVLTDIQDTHPWAWIPFIMFIIVTAFVVVNLIIAVICDAVHVMGNDSKAALVGYESEDFSEGMDSNLYDGGINHTSPVSTEQRLQDLQQQLDEMVMVQDQMKTTIEVLIQQLRENTIGKVRPLSIDSQSQAIPSKCGAGPHFDGGMGNSSDSRSM